MCNETDTADEDRDNITATLPETLEGCFRMIKQIDLPKERTWDIDEFDESSDDITSIDEIINRLHYIRDETNIRFQDFNDYRIANFDPLVVIGEGGFAMVSVVRCKNTGMVFAMKQISLLDVINKISPFRIYSEIHILCAAAELSLSDARRGLPNEIQLPDLVNKILRDSPEYLPTIVAAWVEGSFVYILQEFCSGGDLMHHLIKEDIFSEELTLSVATMLFKAVDYIHNTLGYAHRDIKPDNVMFTGTGGVKLVDFGFSKAIPRGTNDPCNSSNPCASQWIQFQKVVEDVALQSKLTEENYRTIEMLLNAHPEHHFSTYSPRAILGSSIQDAKTVVYTLDKWLQNNVAGFHSYVKNVVRNDRDNKSELKSDVMTYIPFRESFFSDVGTTEYMSPETVKNQYSSSSDYWSIGIVIFEMILGGLPWPARSDKYELGEVVVNYKDVFPAEGFWDGTNELTKEVICALVTDKEERVSSLEDLKNVTYYRDFDFDAVKNVNCGVQCQPMSLIEARGDVATRLRQYFEVDISLDDLMKFFQRGKRAWDGQNPRLVKFVQSVQLPEAPQIRKELRSTILDYLDNLECRIRHLSNRDLPNPVVNALVRSPNSVDTSSIPSIQKKLVNGEDGSSGLPSSDTVSNISLPTLSSTVGLGQEITTMMNAEFVSRTPDIEKKADVVGNDDYGKTEETCNSKVKVLPVSIRRLGSHGQGDSPGKQKVVVSSVDSTGDMSPPVRNSSSDTEQIEETESVYDYETEYETDSHSNDEPIVIPPLQNMETARILTDDRSLMETSFGKSPSITDTKPVYYTEPQSKRVCDSYSDESKQNKSPYVDRTLHHPYTPIDSNTDGVQRYDNQAIQGKRNILVPNREVISPAGSIDTNGMNETDDRNSQVGYTCTGISVSSSSKRTSSVEGPIHHISVNSKIGVLENATTPATPATPNGVLIEVTDSVYSATTPSVSDSEVSDSSPDDVAFVEQNVAAFANMDENMVDPITDPLLLEQRRESMEEYRSSIMHNVSAAAMTEFVVNVSLDASVSDTSSDEKYDYTCRSMSSDASSRSDIYTQGIQGLELRTVQILAEDAVTSRSHNITADEVVVNTGVTAETPVVVHKHVDLLSYPEDVLEGTTSSVPYSDMVYADIQKKPMDGNSTSTSLFNEQLVENMAIISRYLPDNMPDCMNPDAVKQASEPETVVIVLPRPDPVLEIVGRSSDSVSPTTCMEYTNTEEPVSSYVSTVGSNSSFNEEMVDGPLDLNDPYIALVIPHINTSMTGGQYAKCDVLESFTTEAPSKVTSPQSRTVSPACHTNTDLQVVTPSSSPTLSYEDALTQNNGSKQTIPEKNHICTYVPTQYHITSTHSNDIHANVSCANENNYRAYRNDDVTSNNLVDTHRLTAAMNHGYSTHRVQTSPVTVSDRARLPYTDYTVSHSYRSLSPVQQVVPTISNTYPPTLTNNPPTLTNNPPTLTNNPPTLTNNPPTLTNNPPTLTNNPPTLTNNPPTLTNNSPTLTNNPPTLTNTHPPMSPVQSASPMRSITTNSYHYNAYALGMATTRAPLPSNYSTSIGMGNTISPLGSASTYKATTSTLNPNTNMGSGAAPSGALLRTRVSNMTGISPRPSQTARNPSPGPILTSRPATSRPSHSPPMYASDNNARIVNDSMTARVTKLGNSASYGRERDNTRSYGLDNTRSYGLDSTRTYGQGNTHSYGQTSPHSYGLNSTRIYGQANTRIYGQTNTHTYGPEYKGSITNASMNINVGLNQTHRRTRDIDYYPTQQYGYSTGNTRTSQSNNAKIIYRNTDLEPPRNNVVQRNFNTTPRIVMGGGPSGIIDEHMRVNQSTFYLGKDAQKRPSPPVPYRQNAQFASRHLPTTTMDFEYRPKEPTHMTIVSELGGAGVMAKSYDVRQTPLMNVQHGGQVTSQFEGYHSNKHSRGVYQ